MILVVWTLPQLAAYLTQQARLQQFCIVRGVNASTSCVNVTLLHAPGGNYCAHISAGGSQARLRTLRVA